MKTINRKLSFTEACAQYVHRFTMEHVPAWALKPMDNGKYYAPQFRTDREWYENTSFYGEPGYIGSSSTPHCYTTGQTWPLGKSLSQPYNKIKEFNSMPFDTDGQYDVLACLTKCDPGTFENFCSEYGYDSDSRKALKTYKAVRNEWQNLCKLFTESELEQLQEIN